MEHDFWHQRWARGEIGFHEGQVNAYLVAHFDKLGLAAGARVFLPLCGKTRDIAWLLSQDMRVAGAELSPVAVKALFEELGVEPRIEELGTLQRYSADDIDIFVGDIFELSAEQLGHVDAVYDRAALVALPPGAREAYATHLPPLTGAAPQLLIAFDYDQAQLDGPPFSVPAEEIDALYGRRYAATPIARHAVEGGLKGKVAATEIAWLLRPREPAA